MQILKESVDWEYIIPNDETTTTNLKILSGAYTDTVYQYGKVKFEEESDGAMYLRFVYNIIETPLNAAELEKSAEFKNYIGDVLVNIMSQNMEKGIDDEVGTDYSEEFDPE